MKQVNYVAMNNQELKRYMLTHREETKAFNAYLDRRHSCSNKTVIQFDDPAWEEKVISVIQEKLDFHSQ
ncbi:MAG: hypothetical protein AAGA80_20135 [Cyanobacteria bacterium P01_F01_bin.143]